MTVTGTQRAPWQLGPRVYVALGIVILLVLRLLLRVVLDTPVDQLIAILRWVVQIAIGALLLWAGYRVLYKRVPDGFIGVIWRHGRRECVAFPFRNKVLVWPWQHFELHDQREKSLELTVQCPTRDRITVTLKVNLRWQVEDAQLQTYLNMGIDGPKVLEGLIRRRLVYDVIRHNLDAVQGGLPVLTFHLQRLLTWDLYGAELFGIVVHDPVITSLTLPPGITALAEQAKQHELERQTARHRRLIGAGDRLIDAQARAGELLTLAQVIDDIPRTLEFAEVLEIVKNKSAVISSQESGVRTQNTKY